MFGGILFPFFEILLFTPVALLRPRGTVAILVAQQSFRDTEASAGDKGLGAARSAFYQLWCALCLPPALHTCSAQHRLAPSMHPGLVLPRFSHVALRPRGGAGSLSSDKKVGCKRSAKNSHMQTRAGGKVRKQAQGSEERKRRALTTNLKRRFCHPQSK